MRPARLARLVLALGVVASCAAATLADARTAAARAKPTTTVKTTTTRSVATTTVRRGTTTTVTTSTTRRPPTRTGPGNTRTPTTTGATAGSGTSAQPPGVSLVSQTASVVTGGVEIMSLHLDRPALAKVTGAAVAITVHRAVGSRTAFDQAVGATSQAGAALGSTVSQVTFPLPSTSRNKHGDFLVAFGLTGSGVTPAVSVDQPGVYPLEVGVVGAGDRATFVTWLVVVEHGQAAIQEPLRVSWIWRFSAHPLHRASGVDDPSVLAQMRPGGRLARIAELLRSAPHFPLTLGIGPETLESWAALAKTTRELAPLVATVEGAAGRPSTQLLPEPYVPVDGPTIEAEGLGGTLPKEYVAGSNTIDALTSAIPDPSTAFVDPVDDATVGRLSQMLVGRFVVRDTALAPIPQPFTPAQPFTLTTTGAPPTPAAATDSGVEKLLSTDGTPALRAQRVLAALAEIAYEAPSKARGIVLAMPADWDPNVATISTLLQELESDPLVRPSTLDDLFANVPADQRNGTPLARQLLPGSPPRNLPLLAQEYDKATHDLAAYASMVGGGDPSVAAGRHALLIALSTALDRADALGQLATVTDDLQTLTNGIKVTARTLTLTARRASLPLSFENDTKRSGVRVRVHLDSPKLIFPNGPDHVLTLPAGHYTPNPAQFPVEARASGTFVMTVTLESPDGSVVLGSPARVTIQSTVFSGVGIAITIAAVLFLAGWWGNHFRRARRARRRAPSTS